MATYTTNYQLHQWVPEDDFLRTDFNQDFQKIDEALALKADAGTTQTALAAKAEIAAGAYTGDGAESRTITLDFSPKALLLFRTDVESSADRQTLLAYPGNPVISTRDNVTMLEVTAQGFTVRHALYQNGSKYYPCVPITNESGTSYHYLAVK